MVNITYTTNSIFIENDTHLEPSLVKVKENLIQHTVLGFQFPISGKDSLIMAQEVRK